MICYLSHDFLTLSYEGLFFAPSRLSSWCGSFPLVVGWLVGMSDAVSSIVAVLVSFALLVNHFFLLKWYSMKFWHFPPFSAIYYCFFSSDLVHSNCLSFKIHNTELLNEFRICFRSMRSWTPNVMTKRIVNVEFVFIKLSQTIANQQIVLNSWNASKNWTWIATPKKKKKNNLRL